MAPLGRRGTKRFPRQYEPTHRSALGSHDLWDAEVSQNRPVVGRVLATIKRRVA
jgi:hypothetical protein